MSLQNTNRKWSFYRRCSYAITRQDRTLFAFLPQLFINKHEICNFYHLIHTSISLVMNVLKKSVQKSAEIWVYHLLAAVSNLHKACINYKLVTCLQLNLCALWHPTEVVSYLTKRETISLFQLTGVSLFKVHLSILGYRLEAKQDSFLHYWAALCSKYNNPFL